MKKVLVFGCLLLLVSVMVGCGARTDTTRYYYSPSWMRDGKIILIGATESVDKDILGGQLRSSYSQYAMTIYADGTGESSSLFDLTDATPAALSCSPNSDYVAYLDDLRSGLYRRIVIRNIASGQHTELEMAELVFSPGIKSFDWSDDGQRIVYCTTREVRVRNWNDFTGVTDTLVTPEVNLSFVSWKYGDMIAYVSTSKGTFLIRSNGTGHSPLLTAGTVVDKPQVSKQDGNLIYGTMNDRYVEVNVSGGTTSEVLANFAGELPRLSPDATKATYSKAGEESGIYILNIVAKVETKIK